MRKNKKDNYSDVNNSMDNSKEDEYNKNNKKTKKNKKEKKEKIESNSKNNTFNILDEIKREDDSNQKAKILEEVNNTMMDDSDKQKKEKERKKKREKDIKMEEEKEKEKQGNEDKKKDKNKEKEKEKDKDKEKTKTNKKNKKVNNIINDTFNEIANELEEQYNLEIENIFEINNKFSYPKDSPVFYIKEDSSNSDLYPYPLSTIKIKDLLKKKEIKPYLVKVKLIDIFTMKNYEPFSFFDCNDILMKNWSKNVEYSSLFLNEYNNLYEKNKKENIEENYKSLEISFNTNEFFSFPKKEKKLKFDDNKKVEKNKKQEEKKNDLTLHFNISEINKNNYNDLSMSLIKQLEGINMTKKKFEKITSIIEEVEEDDWTEIKSKKKEKDKKPVNYIVGLNESRQIIEPEEIKTNKKKNKGKKKKRQFVNFNNQFAGLKVDHGSDDDEDEK